MENISQTIIWNSHNRENENKKRKKRKEKERTSNRRDKELPMYIRIIDYRS